MRSPLKLNAISAVMIALALAACAKGGVKSAATVEGVRTKAAQALEQRLRLFEDSFRRIKALAWFRIESPERDLRGDAAIVVERPDRLRVDAMDALADVWASAGSDGQNIWLYVPGKNKLYEGRATAANISRLVSFELRPSDLISLLAGSPPVGSEGDVMEEGTARDGPFLFTGSGLRCWLAKGRVARCEKRSDGGAIDYEIAFSDYRKVGSENFPHFIEARFPGSSASLAIKYKEVEAAGSVEDKAFDAPLVHGVSRHRYNR